MQEKCSHDGRKRKGLEGMATKGSEFFDELGVTIAKTAKGLGEKAELLYETQRLRSRISGEERLIGRIKEDLGNILYQHYLDGEELPDEQRILCEQIEQHKASIEEYKKKMASYKKKKVCPSCKRHVDQSVSFCPYCGAACPDEETEDKDEDVVAVVSPEDVVEEPANTEEGEEKQEESQEQTGSEKEEKKEA